MFDTRLIGCIDPPMEPIVKSALPAPGWYASLLPHYHGGHADLATWRRELTDQADAVLVRGPMDLWYLTSDMIARAPDFQSARKYASALLDDLTVRMALSHATLPFAIRSMDLIGANGSRHMHSFSYMGLDSSISAQEAPSPAKKVLRALPKLERARLLLIQYRKSFEWREMYSTIELAEIAVGKKDRLRKLLDGKSEQYDHLRKWTNLFRHAAPDNEAGELTKAEALPLLEDIVRVALANVAEPQEAKPCKGM